MFLLDLFIKRKTKIGLVIGGGGSKGFYHMGVIKALQELDVKIDIISGTSVGAIVGMIYAYNPKVDFDKIANELDFFKIIEMVMSHIDKTPKSKLQDLLKKYIKAKKFEDLKIPIIFNAVDINNAKEIIFNKGSIFPEIFSSMSIPGIFPPLEYKGMYLVDGGVINNIPVHHIAHHCNKIIISDISANIIVNNKTSKINILRALVAVAQKNNTLENILELKSIKNKKTIILKLKEEETFFLDFRKKNYRRLMEKGYNDVMNNKKNIINN